MFLNLRLMYMFNQDLANRIAATQQMATREMKQLFQATESQAKDMEKELRTELLKETKDELIAAAVTAYIPLLAECRSISDFITSSGDSELRIQIPEIITAEEAGLFAEMEFSLNQDQTNDVVRILANKCAALSYIRLENEAVTRQ